MAHTESRWRAGKSRQNPVADRRHFCAIMWYGLFRPRDESSHRDPQSETRLLHHLLAETYDGHLLVHGL
jgi:hypothetical protein